MAHFQGLYIYNEGATATKPEMLVFETQKIGSLKVSLRTHNHMLSTQLPRVQAYTHTGRVHGCKAWFLAKKKPPFLDLLRSMSAQQRDIQGNIILAECLDHDCACGNGIQTNILGTSLTWKPAMRFGAWI